MAEFRLVNAGIGVTRSFLEITKDVADKILDSSIGVLDKVEEKLPTLAFVSEPRIPTAYRALPPGRMRALPSPSGPAQMVVEQPPPYIGVATRGTL